MGLVRAVVDGAGACGHQLPCACAATAKRMQMAAVMVVFILPVFGLCMWRI
jgi:hypothetical protein